MKSNQTCTSASVSSLFHYVETLACKHFPRFGKALLGVRWDFGSQGAEGDPALCEFSLPLRPRPFCDLLAERSRLKLTLHRGDQDLKEHLHLGEPAIVAVNTFYLPHRPAYGRVHSHRTVLVLPFQRKFVWVIDDWPPIYSGPLEWPILERARYCPVPVEPRFEPVFSGGILSGNWFSLRVEPAHAEWPEAWCRSLLRILAFDDSGRHGIHTADGIAALRSFCEDMNRSLYAGDNWQFLYDKCRRAALILRSELSSRVYFAAFLRTAGESLKLADLTRIGVAYEYGLKWMRQARDMLVKQSVMQRPAYATYITECMQHALATETRLSEELYSLPI